MLSTVAEVRAAVAAARGSGLTIGLVPTMGALHAGHAALVRRAAERTDFVVVSVFVNPTQFGPSEDFAKYPRTLDADVSLVGDAGGHAVFAPSAAEVYPPGSVTTVEVRELDRELCGPRRPGHFRGVATVVLKLLNMVGPDVAVFGAKDGQQARIIRRMVKDLNVPVGIDVAPTVREPDGLAMSSRNRYLSPDERAAAPGIHTALTAARDAVRAGETDGAVVEAELGRRLATIPGAVVEYAQVVDDESLSRVERIARPVLIACAVRLGSTRLIDNVEAP